MKNYLSLLLLFAACWVSAPLQGEGYSPYLSSGLEVTENAHRFYMEALSAYCHDLCEPDLIFRQSIEFGEYDYYSSSSTTSIDGDFIEAEALVGIQSFSCNYRVRGFIGAHYTDHNLSPSDASNRVDGDELGVKVRVEALIDPCDELVIDLIGSYSTAYQTYWNYAMVGRKCGCLTVGAEVTALGNASYDSQRYGIVVRDMKFFMSRLSLSSGYSHMNARGKSGYYIAVRW